MEKEVLNFDDFFKDNINANENVDIFEEIVESDFKLTEERIEYLIKDFDLTEDELSNIIESNNDNLLDNSDSNYYNLYKDINENFVCDIFIEGSNPESASVRLVLESNQWNLVFNGYIENGKCNIPIKKLDILSENLIGDIRLEVIAEGNVFIPWKDKFLVKTSKSIKTTNESFKRDIDVKVKGIK